MDDTLTPVRNPDYKLEKFDNEILLYSVSDTRAVYLNETAFLVYGMCGTAQTIGTIIATLEEAYPEQQATIRADVTQAISQLAEHGAIRFHD